MVAHAFNPSTREVETGKICLREEYKAGGDRRSGQSEVSWRQLQSEVWWRQMEYGDCPLRTVSPLWFEHW